MTTDRARSLRGSPPSFATTDDLDLKLASDELAAGRAMLQSAHAIADRHERDEAIASAVGRLALASRAIGTVVARRTRKEPEA